MLTGGRRLRPTARSSRWFRRLRAALAWAVLDLVGAMSVALCAPCVDATPRVPVRTAIAATIRIAEATQRLRP